VELQQLETQAALARNCARQQHWKTKKYSELIRGKQKNTHKRTIVVDNNSFHLVVIVAHGDGCSLNVGCRRPSQLAQPAACLHRNVY
jgi:hypothetical protein